MAINTPPVQHNSGASGVGGAGSVTATFGSTPTQNNLLTAQVFTRSDTSLTNPTNWSTAIDIVNVGNADTLRIAYRIAGASEPTAVTFTVVPNDNSALGIFEWSGNVTSTPVDKTGTTGITTGVTSISSGTTATTTQADEVSIVAYALRNIVTLPSLNNSFTFQHQAASAGGGGPTTEATLLDGYHIETATGAKTATASWTTAANSMGAIATFKAASGGGGRTVLNTRAFPLGMEVGMGWRMQ